MNDAKSKRLERVEHEIVRELSELLHKELKDPRVGFVTITGAKISPDLSSARVFASPMGDARAVAQSMKGLESAAGFLSGELGKRLGMRRTPAIHFVRDESIERGVKLTNIIDEVQRRDEARANRPKE
ncbi:MAG TPA: 30S ribosome-binding factor RbfA [Candidatus Eremiobacteraceae bacterium]|nr:30S ribosome-binding factor RbfA [Candidatus Eremiobacteraceae bacterium]